MSLLYIFLLIVTIRVCVVGRSIAHDVTSEKMAVGSPRHVEIRQKASNICICILVYYIQTNGPPNEEIICVALAYLVYIVECRCV